MSAKNSTDNDAVKCEVAANAEFADKPDAERTISHTLCLDTDTEGCVKADKKEVGVSADINKDIVSMPSTSKWRLPLTVDIVSTGITSPPGLRSKYVVYFLHLRLSNRVHSDDCHNDCIERRYTDFRLLHRSLKKAYPDIMSKLVFPKKLYTGNFTPENIARRSQAFEQYLCHLLDIPEIQYCDLFMSFFYSKELKDGIKSFHKLQYSVSISKMSKAARNLELMLSPSDKLVIFTYAVMVSCYSCLNDHFECYQLATKAINSIDLESCGGENSFLLPLLIKAVHMAVSLGKDKSALEVRISQQQFKSGKPVEDIPTLQEVLLGTMETGYNIPDVQ